MPDTTTKTSPYQGGDPDPQARIDEIVDGRYRLLEFVGQGGMGNVYRAEHVTIRKPVALKLLHPSLAGIAEIRSRFEREAFAIGRIEHPNCIEVFDFGELGDGSLYLAMEYLDGESAADLIDRERILPPSRALPIIRHILSGLSHAHRVGIVHRDVKPENIFIVNVVNATANSPDPSFAKILDFGIAKLVDGSDVASKQDEKLTQAGITFGTPAYLSPEQALGDPADHRSDLYSVGVVLFELLAGVPPFSSPDKMELLAMHANRKAPRLAERAPGNHFPEALELVLAKSLSKRRKDRFASGDEFIAAIDGLGLFERAPSFADSTSGMYTPLPGPSALLPAFSPAPLARAQSSSAQKSSVRWYVLGAIAVLVAIATAIVFLTNQEPLLANLQTEQSDISRESDLALAQGDPDEAIEVVEKEPSSETDASAQLSLGHAYASQADYKNAAAAYKRALTLDQNSIDDAQMVTNLRLMVDRNGKIHFEALELLIEYAEDEESISRLVGLAASNKLELRRKAFPLAEKLGHGGSIDRTKSFIADLRQLPDCEDRRKAVAKLRALGDPVAIKPLTDAFVRKVRGRRGNQNRCLAGEVKDAVRYLESRPKPSVDPVN